MRFFSQCYVVLSYVKKNTTEEIIGRDELFMLSTIWENQLRVSVLEGVPVTSAGKCWSGYISRREEKTPRYRKFWRETWLNLVIWIWYLIVGQNSPHSNLSWQLPNNTYTRVKCGLISKIRSNDNMINTYRWIDVVGSNTNILFLKELKYK